MAGRSGMTVETLNQKVSGLVAFLSDSARKRPDHAALSDNAGRAAHRSDSAGGTHRRTHHDERGSRTSRPAAREHRRSPSRSRRTSTKEDDRRGKDRGSVRRSRSRSPRGGRRGHGRSVSRPATKQEHERHHSSTGPGSSAVPGRGSARAATKEPPQVQVDGPNDEQKFRASHRRVMSATSMGRHATVCDLVVLGPWRTRREAADEDAKDLRSSFEKRGEDGLLQAVSALWTPNMHPSWPPTSGPRVPGLRGWQLEVENSDDGNRRCRAICVLDTSRSRPSATPTNVFGQWRPSRVRAEEDAMHLLAEYQHAGLSAALKAALGNSSASSTAQPAPTDSVKPRSQSGSDGNVAPRPGSSDRRPRSPAPPRPASPAPGTTMAVKSKGAPPIRPPLQRFGAMGTPPLMAPPPHASAPQVALSMMGPQRVASNAASQMPPKAEQPPLQRRFNGCEGGPSATAQAIAHTPTSPSAPWRQQVAAPSQSNGRIDAGKRDAGGGSSSSTSKPSAVASLPRRITMPKSKAVLRAQPATTTRPVLARPRFAKANAGQGDGKPAVTAVKKVFLKPAVGVTTAMLKRPTATPKGHPKAKLKANPPAKASQNAQNQSDDDWGHWSADVGEKVKPKVASPAGGAKRSVPEDADDDWGEWKAQPQDTSEKGGKKESSKYANDDWGEWTAASHDKAVPPAKAVSPSVAAGAIQPLAGNKRADSSARIRPIAPTTAGPSSIKPIPRVALVGRAPPSAPAKAAGAAPSIRPQPPKNPPPTALLQRRASESKPKASPQAREPKIDVPRVEQEAEESEKPAGQASAFEALGEVWKLL
mmetsp:Transcript_42102/g.94654  ORF Transcript_42102/g.94654 Transcript_42102/m.94654 type:complete len:817 (-) Transcript_42102:7-2457(-)